MVRFKFWTLTIVLLICIHKTRSFDGCLCVEEFADGLHLPVDLVHANDGSNRIFVAELNGVVNVYHANGTKLSQPFMDVSATTGHLPATSEYGLTSLAFHPNFRANGLFYALVTTESKSEVFSHYSNLFEFKVSTTDLNKADPDYSRLLLNFEQARYTHNADQLLFGIDNYLYVFIGDGGIQKDPHNWAQNMDKYLGKILRIDVDSRTGSLPYGIPEDNPFNNGSYSIPEIYALGVRNPWRGGMDHGDRFTGEGRGRIIFGDVGQDTIEELDLLEMGANYEWNIKEANLKHCKKDCLKGPGKFTAPIYSYARSSRLGKAVIGGQFYRGCRSPKFNGAYFWGDSSSGLLFRLKEDKTTGTWQNKEVEMCQPSACEKPLQSSYAGHMTSFGLDEEGELYMITSVGRQVYKPNGHIYRLVEPTQPGDPEPCKTILTQNAMPNDLMKALIGEPSGGQDEVKAKRTDSSTEKVNNLVEDEHEDLSPQDQVDGNDKKIMNTLLDIADKGNLYLKKTLAKFLAKLLARLYYEDFSSQDEDAASDN